MKKRISMLLSGLLAVGIGGYFAFFRQWLRYIFAHAGGLAIMGFLGLLTGTIATRKGYNYKRAVGLGFVLPTLLGIMSVLAVRLEGGRGCGGIVSLAASLPVLFFYCIARKKMPDDRIQEGGHGDELRRGQGGSK